MAQYIPVRSGLRKDCEALHKIYKKAKNSLGKGSFGEVYQACIRETRDCEYVLKVSTYDHRNFLENGGKSIQRYVGEWGNEVEVFNRVNKLQEQLGVVFSPKLYDSWFCRTGEKFHFYILMEKYDGDLFRLLPDHTNKYNEYKDTPIYRDVVIYRNIAILTMLDRMDLYLESIHHNLKICLNDIKLQNILYKITDDGMIQIVFSDFGIASQHSDDECIRIDRENFNALKKEFRIIR